VRKPLQAAWRACPVFSEKSRPCGSGVLERWSYGGMECWKHIPLNCIVFHFAICQVILYVEPLINNIILKATIGGLKLEIPIFTD
jgi:hypothetical protein